MKHFKKNVTKELTNQKISPLQLQIPSANSLSKVICLVLFVQNGDSIEDLKVEYFVVFVAGTFFLKKTMLQRPLGLSKENSQQLPYLFMDP